MVEIFELLVQPELLFQFEDLVLAELRVTLRLVPPVDSLSLLKSLMVLVSPTGINIL